MTCRLLVMDYRDALDRIVPAYREARSDTIEGLSDRWILALAIAQIYDDFTSEYPEGGTPPELASDWHEAASEAKASLLRLVDRERFPPYLTAIYRRR